MFKIQEFSKKTGVSKRMLRYLEEQGLLIPTRKENDYRLYHSHHIEEIQWIQFWQRLGFSLIQIKSLKDISPSKLENQLEELLKKKKQELATHSTQISTIRNLIKKMRTSESNPSLLDLRKQLSLVETWEANTRDEFFNQIICQDRVVYGKFPEIESVVNLVIDRMKNAGFNLSFKTCDIMKTAGAAQQLPASEVIIWERKSDYTYFSIAISEETLNEPFSDELEDSLHLALQEALNLTFYPCEMDQAGRLFDAKDILQFNASHEITFLCKLNLERSNHLLDIYLLVPFQFIHNSRHGLSQESSTLARTLQKVVSEATHESLLKKKKKIPNLEYTITAFLVDAETRHKMLSALSADEKQSVIRDVTKLTNGILTNWSKT